MKISKEKLKQIIKEELSKLTESVAIEGEDKAKELLAYAERLCELLPVQCTAAVQFVDGDREERELDIDAMIERLRTKMRIEEEEEEPDIGIEDCTPCIVITLGDAPSDNYNDDVIALYYDRSQTFSGAIGGATLENYKNINSDWLIQQSRHANFYDLDPTLIEKINDMLQWSNVELKPGFIVDVDLD